LNAPQFQWAVVVFGMILGLSVTRILTGLIASFRSRVNALPEGAAVLWAVCIFLLQLELWWALSDLRSIIKEWTFPLFLLFTSSPLLLFFAAALVLPSHELGPHESHQEIFRRNGRWALLAISAYYLESLLETLYFWHASLMTMWAVLNGVLIVLPTLAFFSAPRFHRLMASIALALTLLFVFVDVAIPAPV
jgi:hypothetical protein